MEKKFLRIGVIFLLIFSLFYKSAEAVESNGTSDENVTDEFAERYSIYPYVINKYDINIVVNENNRLDITENITVYFNEYKHGIYKMIPLKNTVKRLDGTSSIVRAQVLNISANEKFSKSRAENKIKIQLGESSKTYIGEKNYQIKYTYNLGKDVSSDYDELYFNIIGTEWDVPISNVSFEIMMPKEFDSQKLGFSSGRYGSTENANVIYNVDGNNIEGKYNGTLNPGEALTVRCELDEGYFVGAGYEYGWSIKAILLISIISLIVCRIIWYRYGKPHYTVDAVEYYPPNGYNSLKLAFLYRGEVREKDVVSLLIYLASKGYIKIEEYKDENTKKRKLRITMLKRYAGKDKYEKKFMEKLFNWTKVEDKIALQITQAERKVGKIISFTQALEMAKKEKLPYITIDEEELKERFKYINSDIFEKINLKSNRDKIFDKISIKKTKFLKELTIFVVLVVILILNLQYSGFGESVMVLVAMSLLTYAWVRFCQINMRKIKKILLICVLSVFTISFTNEMPFIELISDDFNYFWTTFISGICVIIMCSTFKHMPKRAKEYEEILGRIKGFKCFLETAEKERLEQMVNENPTYFYDILPYTYVLDISDKWIKKFEYIVQDTPTWYESSYGFASNNVNHFMNHTVSDMERSMRKATISNNRSRSWISNGFLGGSSGGSFGGGSSSGGGFSGGGSGGGGGGSW